MYFIAYAVYCCAFFVAYCALSSFVLCYLALTYYRICCGSESEGGVRAQIIRGASEYNLCYLHVRCEAGIAVYKIDIAM